MQDVVHRAASRPVEGAPYAGSTELRGQSESSDYGSGRCCCKRGPVDRLHRASRVATPIGVANGYAVRLVDSRGGCLCGSL